MPWNPTQQRPSAPDLSMIQLWCCGLPRSSMKQSDSQTIVVLFGSFLLIAAILFIRPSYFASPEALGIFLIGQIVLASICKFKESFFLVLMGAFFWAGMRLPLSGAWLEGRWIVLAVGSFAGLAIYLKNRNHRFSTIHLFALFCVLSAFVSGSVSAYPQEALLKSLSLFLLFLYGTTGARLACYAPDRDALFRRLLLAAEVTIYVSLLAYFGLRLPLFGNPNSLGAVMGIVIIPLMFWGFLSTNSIVRKRRMAFGLCLAVTLLLSSLSRAGITAAVISCIVLCISLRRYRLIVGGLAFLVVVSILVATFIPPPTEDQGDNLPKSIISLFLYKGKPEVGLMGSRRAPWQATIAVIKNHPWFGSGFGTSTTDLSATYFELTRARFVDSRMVREHGNSYLAIMEWSGLLGVLPFYLLVCAAAWQASKAFIELRRTANIFSPAVPAAAIIIAGLIGATFEDWLFAVGYYVSVFFWSMAFILTDLVQAHFITDLSDPFAVDTPPCVTLAVR